MAVATLRSPPLGLGDTALVGMEAAGMAVADKEAVGMVFVDKGLERNQEAVVFGNHRWVDNQAVHRTPDLEDKAVVDHHSNSGLV